MASKIARKVRRAGKSATQFRFTSTFEYIDLTCNGTWRPNKLRIIWLRSQRRVQSSDVEFVITEDRGPNGADGRAVFDPPITVSLVVTLYRDQKKQEFEEKEYKYYIENEDKSGRKILASFNCDMAEYAGIPTSRHALEMNFKSVSRKVSKSLLGITLESEFIKEGKATDDDMQSTFSAVDPGQSTLYADDEDVDDDDLDEAATLGMRTIQDKTPEPEEPIESPEIDTSIITLGTGQILKRSEIDHSSPPEKPPRRLCISLENLLGTDDIEKQEINNEIKNFSSENDINSAVVESNVLLLSDVSNIIENIQELCSKKIQPTVQEIQPTVQEIQPAVQEIQTTVQETQPTVQEIQPAVQEIQPAVQEIQTTVQEIQPAVQEIQTTVQEIQPTVQEIQPTVQEIQTTVQEIQPTVQEIQPTVQEIQTTVQEIQPTIQPTVREIQPIVQEIEPTVQRTVEDATEEVQPIVQPTSYQSPLIDQSNQNELQQKPVDIYTETTPTAAELALVQNTAVPPINHQYFQNSTNHKLLLDMNSTCDDGRHLNLEGPPPQTEFEETRDRRKSVSSKETTPEPEPPLVPPNEDTPPTSGNLESIKSWLPDPQFVDFNDVPVPLDKIGSAEIIGLYFSAQWCPPCRRFLPKLLEFYTALKKNGKAFELIYVSNDNSRTEMVQYMQEQQMPWLAIPHGNPLIDKLKLDYKVRSIPLLVIVSAGGDTLDENAKKVVESTHVAASSCVKQYLKWMEKINSEDDETKQKSSGGIFSSLKKALSRDSVEREVEPPPQVTHTEQTEMRSSAESKIHKSIVNDKHNKDELLRQLREKEDIIRHLEEVNMSLKHTNEELNTEIRTLKTSLELSQVKVKELEETTAQKQAEDAKLKEYLTVQGWLFKKGIKGPTANVYRKRYFRLDQGSKLYYYKSQSEGQPQGFIDLVKIVSVSEVTPSQQDKNNASFNIDCEGRTFQLQSYDETDMRRWISAISYLSDYYRRKGATPN